MAEQQQQVSEASRKAALRAINRFNESMLNSSRGARIERAARTIDQDKADVVKIADAIETIREKHLHEDADALRSYIELVAGKARQALNRHTQQGDSDE